MMLSVGRSALRLSSQITSLREASSFLESAAQRDDRRDPPPPLLTQALRVYSGNIISHGFCGAWRPSRRFEDAPLQRQLLSRKSLFRPWNRTMRRQGGSAASLLLTSTLASSANLRIQVC